MGRPAVAGADLSARALAVGLGLAVALVAGPAQADTWTGTDAAGDVTATTYDPTPEPCGTSTVTAAPDDALHDITRLRVAHRPAAVELRLTLRQVSRGADAASFTFALHTRDDVWLFFVSPDDTRHGRLSGNLVRMPRRLHPDECGATTFASAGTGCPEARVRADTARDQVSARIPRSCMGEPRWVQVGVYAYGITGSYDGVHTDTGDDLPDVDPSVGALTYGPRVRVG